MKTVVITGKKNSGKTFLLNQIVEFLKQQKISYDGIISIPVIDNGIKIGFDSLRLADEKLSLLCRKDYISSLSTTYYSFNTETFSAANDILKRLRLKKTEILIIDEIGTLEIRDEGWAYLLTNTINIFSGILIITLRKNLIFKLIEKFKLNPKEIIDLDEIKFEDAKSMIYAIISEFIKE